MVVVDTHVLSEALRPEPDGSVRRWLERQRPDMLFTTAVCEAEILFGAALMPAGRRRRAFEEIAKALFEEEFAGRILPFDSDAAREFGVIASSRREKGRPISQFDAQIAAIARSRGAALATRNNADFRDCGIELIDPWKG